MAQISNLSPLTPGDDVQRIVLYPILVFCACQGYAAVCRECRHSALEGNDWGLEKCCFSIFPRICGSRRLSCSISVFQRTPPRWTIRASKPAKSGDRTRRRFPPVRVGHSEKSTWFECWLQVLASAPSTMATSIPISQVANQTECAPYF